MAEVGALDAVKKIRGLPCHENEINEVANRVVSLVSMLRRTRRLFGHFHLIEESDYWEVEYVIFKAYLMEDVLETFVVDVAAMLQKNEPWFIKSFIIRKSFPELYSCFVLKNIKKKIFKLKIERFNGYLSRYERMIINNEPREASQGQRRLRQTYPRGIGEHFIGMDDELNKLVSLVRERQSPVISIWGETGMGKTTIAAKIYEDRKVIRRFFYAFAWVCLSEGCDISILLLNILSQLSPKQVDETTQEETLIDHLKGVLSRKRCLIVLDNVQDMDQWTKLSPTLQVEGRRSVILLTTREENIANSVGSSHKLRLHEDEAWDLLKKHAFPRKDAPGPDVGLFPRLGKEMVRKCGYLPSAISRLGKNLSSKNSLSDWQMMNNDVSEYIKGHQIEENGQLLLMSSLDSEYANLPYYLKQCFLYLGNFSKDEEIDVEDLYFLWIAEGMVSSVNELRKKTIPDLVNEEETRQDRANEDREETTQDIANEDREEITLDVANENREETILERNEEQTTQDIANIDWEDIMIQDIANVDRKETAMDRAEKYLNELASKGVVRVQRDELSATRRSQSCFLCSPTRDLSSWEEEKEDFCLEIIDFRDGKQSMFVYHEARRLAIHFNQQAKNMVQIYGPFKKYFRSLFLLNSSNKSVESPLEITDYRKFKLLRVLNFVRCKFDGRKLPKGIDRLFNLRYLGLLYCDLDELPSSIGHLRNLRVLNVRVHDNDHLVIKNGFLHKLVLLSQLRLPYYANREETEKLILGNLLELETLFGFNSLIHDLRALSKLKNLRHLGAHAYSNDSLKSLLGFIMSACIRTKLFIENTCDFTSKEGVAVLEDVLMCPNLHTLTLSMVLMKVPDCGPYISSDLTQLKLIGCKIKEDPMEVLGKFPNLQKLCLGHGAFLGEKMAIQANGFPNLAYLEIRSLPYFEYWWVDEGAMRNLSDLIIRRCPRLKMIPDGLVSISNLKNLEIELESEAFVRVRGEYLGKFKFVPTINIRKVEPCSTS